MLTSHIIPNNLRFIREKKGLKQKQLADKAKAEINELRKEVRSVPLLSPSVLSLTEAGEYNLKDPVWSVLAKVLEVPVEALTDVTSFKSEFKAWKVKLKNALKEADGMLKDPVKLMPIALRYIRDKKHGLTLQQASDKVGTSNYNQYFQYETGKKNLHDEPAPKRNQFALGFGYENYDALLGDVAQSLSDKAEVGNYRSALYESSFYESAHTTLNKLLNVDVSKVGALDYLFNPRAKKPKTEDAGREKLSVNYDKIDATHLSLVGKPRNRSKGNVEAPVSLRKDYTKVTNPGVSAAKSSALQQANAFLGSAFSEMNETLLNKLKDRKLPRRPVERPEVSLVDAGTKADLPPVAKFANPKKLVSETPEQVETNDNGSDVDLKEKPKQVKKKLPGKISAEELQAQQTITKAEFANKVRTIPRRGVAQENSSLVNISNEIGKVELDVEVSSVVDESSFVVKLPRAVCGPIPSRGSDIVLNKVDHIPLNSLVFVCEDESVGQFYYSYMDHDGIIKAVSQNPKREILLEDVRLESIYEASAIIMTR